LKKVVYFYFFDLIKRERKKKERKGKERKGKEKAVIVFFFFIFFPFFRCIMSVYFFHCAIQDDDIFEVSSHLENHPHLVNQEGNKKYTALHHACRSGKYEIAKLLLSKPNIDVNSRTIKGCTPFSIACEEGDRDILKMLLDDPRVDTTLVDYRNRAPIWNASRSRNVEVVEMLIVHGISREHVDLKGLHWDDAQYTALEIARKLKCDTIVSLLKRYVENPVLTRYNLCLKWCMPGELAADMFAMIIFLCDGILKLKPNSLTNTRRNENGAARFFLLASKLPMELQMILCRRVLGSNKDMILTKHSEISFAYLTSLFSSRV